MREFYEVFRQAQEKLIFLNKTAFEVLEMS